MATTPARPDHSQFQPAGRRVQFRPARILVQYAALIFFLLVFLIPFVWIWSSAFKTSREIS